VHATEDRDRADGLAIELVLAKDEAADLVHERRVALQALAAIEDAAQLAGRILERHGNPEHEGVADIEFATRDPKRAGERCAAFGDESRNGQLNVAGVLLTAKRTTQDRILLDGHESILRAEEAAFCIADAE
jgi:hypothetical protein